MGGGYARRVVISFLLSAAYYSLLRELDKTEPEHIFNASTKPQYYQNKVKLSLIKNYLQNQGLSTKLLSLHLTFPQGEHYVSFKVAALDSGIFLPIQLPVPHCHCHLLFGGVESGKYSN